MKQTFIRRTVFLYPFLMVLCGLGYAKWDSYQLDGDALAFMDIADALHLHSWHLAINGYWNPAYAAVLALGQVLFHPTRWNELQAYFYCNLAIFIAVIAATYFFLSGLLRLRARTNPNAQADAALSPAALTLATLAILFPSFQRELSLGKVRADALLLLFFLIAASLLLRIQTGAKFIAYPALGLALGCAYLTKSFGFLPSAFLLLAMLIYAITRKAQARKTLLIGTAAAIAVFALVTAPYIRAISHEYGHFTTGESARMNYCFFVDQTPRWHEHFHHDTGHAIDHFKHPEAVLLTTPAVFSYAVHPYGTYPLWFDSAWYTDGLTPHLWLKGHIVRAARCAVLLLRFSLDHPEPFLFLIVLLAAGATLRRSRTQLLPWLPVIAWGLLMFAIYFPIDFQERYLTAPFLFVVIPPLALLRKPRTDTPNFQHITTIAALLLALLTLFAAISDLAARRRTLSVTGYPRGAYSKQIYPAAAGLIALGIQPGDKLACMGDQACYIDEYWARLPQAQILAEIEVPNDGNPAVFWQSLPNQSEVTRTLAAQNIKAIVAIFPAAPPTGWQQLGDSAFYALPLK